jgi:hypothetical protein
VNGLGVVGGVVGLGGGGGEGKRGGTGEDLLNPITPVVRSLVLSLGRWRLPCPGLQGRGSGEECGGWVQGVGLKGGD